MFGLPIIGLALVGALLIIVFTVFAIKKQDVLKEGGEGDMIKKLYVYLVLFATLMMTIGGTVSTFMAVADLVAPPSYYQTYEQYKMEIRYGKVPTEQNLTEEQLRARYTEFVEEEKIRSKQRAINTIIKSLGWIVIPLPVFLYFQKRTKSEG